MTRRLLGSFCTLGLLLSIAMIPACNLLSPGGGGNTNENDNANTNTNDNTNGNDNETDPDLALFTDADTGFSTTVVRDVDDETVQFSISEMSVIYQDGTVFDEGLWEVDGNFLGGGAFQVRFGTVGGEPRAYFTETVPGTICDFRIIDGQFQIFPTTQTVPQN